MVKFDVSLWGIGGAIYILGAILYMCRFPEKWYPNKFDFFVSYINLPIPLGLLSSNLSLLCLDRFTNALLRVTAKLPQ